MYNYSPPSPHNTTMLWIPSSLSNFSPLDMRTTSTWQAKKWLLAETCRSLVSFGAIFSIELFAWGSKSSTWRRRLMGLSTLVYFLRQAKQNSKILLREKSKSKRSLRLFHAHSRTAAKERLELASWRSCRKIFSPRLKSLLTRHPLLAHFRFLVVQEKYKILKV